MRAMPTEGKCHMSHQQPGPYDRQPQQPGGAPNPYGPPQPPTGAPHPYGQPSGLPQPGYGYAQQGPPGYPPQQPAYGYPGAPVPYGQQPAGPMQGMPGTPRSGGNSAKRAGFVIGAVVVGAAVVGGLLLLGGGTRYKLTTPRTVAGEYERKSGGEAGDGAAFAKKKAPGITADGQINATYQAAPTRQLSIGGAYGDVDDPEAGVDRAMGDASRRSGGSGGKPVGDVEEFTPAGFDGDVMKCREFKVLSVSMGMCSWGDSSTLGLVGSVETEAGGMTGKPVDLEKTAELTAEIRGDIMAEAD